MHFPVYAEPIGYTPGQPYEASKSDCESVRMLSAAARDTGTWLIGGVVSSCLSRQMLNLPPGSIPEKAADGKLYNTCTVYSPKG